MAIQGCEAVAYHMTGKVECLDACTRWSDRMIEEVISYAEKLSPGAIYRTGNDRPPHKKGQ
jgi:hypothetical protein